MIFQPTQLAFEKLTLPAHLAPLLLHARREAHGRRHQRARPCRGERVMQRLAKAARLIHRVHGVARCDLLLHPLDQPRAQCRITLGGV